MKPGLQIALIIFGAFLIYQLRLVIVLCVIALTLAAALAPIAEFCEKKRIPRIVSVLSVYLFLAGAYTLLGASIVPTIVREFKHLWQHVPQYAEGLRAFHQQLQTLLGSQAPILDIDTGDLRDVIVSLVARTLNLTAGFSALLLNIIFVLFLGSYLAVDAPNLWKHLFKWIPRDKREVAASLIRPLEDRLGGYIRGQIMVSLFVGVFLAVALSIIRLDYAVLLGAAAAVLNVVPYIGSLTALGFALFIASQQSMVLLAVTIAIFAIEQWIESSVIVPVCLGHQTGLHPLVVLLGIICGATLLGLPGAMASIPILSAALVLAERFYLKTEAEPYQPSPQQSS